MKDEETSWAVKAVAVALFAVMLLYILSLNNSLSAATRSIDSLQEELDSSNQLVEELQSENTSLKDSIDTANDEIASLAGSVDDINNTWYDSCWDLRDAVYELPVPSYIDYELYYLN